MLDITLEDIERVLGKKGKKEGRRYVFQCPVCQDSNEDNLVFDPIKHILKCFSCDEGSKTVLAMINKNKDRALVYKPKEPTKQRIKWYEANRQNLYDYWIQSLEEHTIKSKAYLKNRCISDRTVEECVIGFDSEPNVVKIGPSVTFPMISLNHDEDLVGFELRQINGEKIIRHTLDSPSCLCAIYGKKTSKNIIITEGFIDAYSLVELLEDKKNDYFIVTGSHGCKSILPSLNGLDFSKYSNCYLLLDNDKAGSEATDQIIQNYPFFQDKRVLIKNCKDVNEYLCQKRRNC